MHSVEQAIWQNARNNPNKIAVKSGKDFASYHQLWVRILAAKDILQRHSCYSPGKSVIIGASKQIEFLYVYFGAHLAGLTVVPLDTETNPDRFTYISVAIKPFCIIGFDKSESNIQKLSLKEFKHLNLISERDDLSSIQFPDKDSIADILFTTGTTGNPKGVPLTFQNEAAAARNINSFIINQENDIELLALPVSHSFGLGRVRCCLSNGQTIILLGSFVNTKKLFRTIEEERVTGFSMVPASWKFLQKMSGEKLADYSSQLKYIEMGSSYLSVEDKRHLADLFPDTRMTMHYGLTEASRSAFMEFHKDAHHLDSVGKASPNTDIQIFSQNGEMLPPTQEGEICVKGEHVTKGYILSDNKNSFFGEYFRTGDSGIIDYEGNIYLKSRIKELINVGGKKVSPTEVDEQILKIPGIEDCACVATKDSEGVLGEVVKAFIVRKPDSDLSFEDIKSQLIGKLESYKIPDEFAWIDKIPRTQNGKIQRNLLQSK